jgi:hypothetical protein
MKARGSVKPEWGCVPGEPYANAPPCLFPSIRFTTPVVIALLLFRMSATPQLSLGSPSNILFSVFSVYFFLVSRTRVGHVYAHTSHSDSPLTSVPTSPTQSHPTSKVAIEAHISG